MTVQIAKQLTEVKRLWNLMCDADGVTRDSLFVEFSKTNPHATDYNNAIGRLMEMRSRQARGMAR